MKKTILLDRYEIIEELGRGGSGEVYKAIDRVIDRTVAIKRLHSGTKASSRAVREARATASLEKSNVVRIYDFDKDDSYHYLIMEYVDGVTLAEILEQIPKLSIEESLAIAVEVADAIAAASLNNIIHQDIKPENIMITKNGKVKVTDFGIARLSSSTMTQDGDIVGTLAYMSPEQTSGDAVDNRTDIFSLGVVLYRMLTGQSPFAAPNPGGIVFKILNLEPEPPSIINPDVQPGLEDLVMKSLEKKPAKRLSDMFDFRDELQRQKHGDKPTSEILTPLVRESEGFLHEEAVASPTHRIDRIKLKIKKGFLSRQSLLERVFIATMGSLVITFLLSESVFYSGTLVKVIPFAVFIVIFLFPRIGLLASFSVLLLPLADVALVLPLFLIIFVTVYGLSFYLTRPTPSLYVLLAPLFGILGIGPIYPILTGFIWRPTIAFVIGASGSIALQLTDLFAKSPIRYFGLENSYNVAHELGGQTNPIQALSIMIKPFADNPLFLLQPLLWGAVAAFVSILVKKQSLRKDFTGLIITYSVLLIGQVSLLSNYTVKITAVDALMQTFAASLIILLGVLLLMPRTSEGAERIHHEENDDQLTIRD